MALVPGGAALAVETQNAVESEQVIDEVVVRGQRNLLSQTGLVGAAPMLINVDEQVSLDRTVADWMAQLPGVSLNGQGGLFQSYSLRGFSRWRVRTEIDGVPIITDRRAGNTASFVPPALIQSVAVQLGPAASLYGSGAMGGVVSLATNTAAGTHSSLGVQSNDGAWSLSAGAADANRGVQLTVRGANSAKAPDGETLNTGYEQAGALFHVNRTTDWLGGMDVDVRWLPSVGRDIGKSNANFPRTATTDYPEEHHSVFNIKLSPTMTSNRGTPWALQFYHHFQDWQTRTQVAGDPAATTTTDYGSHTVGGMLYVPVNAGPGTGRYGVEWVGRRGVDITEVQGHNALISDAATSSRQVLDGSSDNLGGFIDYGVTRGSIALGATLRHDWVDQQGNGDSRNQHSTNGALNLSYQLSDHWQLQTEIGSAFRFPSLSELYFDGVTARGQVLGNPNLKPEENLGLTVGSRWEARGVSLTINAYHNWLDDYIERYRVDPQTLSYRNVDSATLWGWEASAEWTLGSVSHLVSYQWQRGTSQTGEVLADLNPPALRYFASGQLRAVRLDSDLSYRASRRIAGPGELPLAAATIWNVRAAFPWSPQLEVAFYVNNLLDDAYRGSADDDAPLQPGRTIGLSMTFEPS